MGKKHKEMKNQGNQKTRGRSRSGKTYRKPVLAVIMLLLFSTVIVLDLVNVQYGASLTQENRQMSSGEFVPGNGQPPQMNADATTSDAASSDSAASDSDQSAGAGEEGTRQRPEMNADVMASDQSAGAGEKGTRQMPQMGPGGDRSQMQSAESSGIVNQILSNTVIHKIMTTAQMYWVAILCVAIAADLLVIFYLISRHNRIKKEKAEAARLAAIRAENGEDEDDDDFDEIDDDDDDGYARRRPVRAAMLPLCLVLAVATVIYQLPTVQSDTSLMTVEAQVVSAQAGSGTVTSTLTGSGSLSGESTVNLSIPSGVTVETYFVSNGDVVESGDLLATVNKTSVEEAIVTLQTAIDDLDADLEADDEAEQEITATASGTVKAIFAEAGDVVTDVMEEYGALMLISLDGSMEVDVDTQEGLSIGSKVTVVLSDGTEETGRVAQMEDGIAKITLPDDNASYQEEVTVKDSDGNEIGSGTLSIHSCLKVTGYYGEVYAVNTSVDSEVSSGDQLLDITDANTAASSEILLDTRAKLEVKMAELYALREDPCIYAQLSGVISGIPEDSSDEEAADSTSADSSDEEVVDSTSADSSDEEVVDSTSVDSSDEETADSTSADGSDEEAASSTASDSGEEADSSEDAATGETSAVVAEEADKTASEDTAVQAAAETTAPETAALETTAPETAAPETTAPETKAPETQAPETKAPETQAPETQAPETPETQAPETKAQETQAQATEAKATETQATEAKTTETNTNETKATEKSESSSQGETSKTEETNSSEDLPNETAAVNTQTEAATEQQTDSTTGDETDSTDSTQSKLLLSAQAESTSSESDQKTTESDESSDDTTPEDGSYYGYVLSIDSSKNTIEIRYAKTKSGVSSTKGTKYSITLDSLDYLSEGAIISFTCKTTDGNTTVSNLTVLLANGTYAAKVTSVSGNTVTVTYASHTASATDAATLSSEVGDSAATYTFTTDSDVSGLSADSMILLTVTDSGLTFEAASSETQSETQSSEGSTENGETSSSTESSETSSSTESSETSGSTESSETSSSTESGETSSSTESSETSSSTESSETSSSTESSETSSSTESSETSSSTESSETSSSTESSETSSSTESSGSSDGKKKSDSSSAESTTEADSSSSDSDSSKSSEGSSQKEKSSQSGDSKSSGKDKTSSESESESSGKTKKSGSSGSAPGAASAKSGSAFGSGGGSASGGSASGDSASGSSAVGTSAEAAIAEAQEQASYDLYNLEEDEILTVAPQNSMTITIEADELDILALREGQSAVITLDALEGRSFTGIVTNVNLVGTNEGGNTKYTATITLDKTDEMLEGMNASVRIETESADTAVTVPAQALVEKDGKTFVYTTYDEKTDTLGGLQEVETGVSDGINVEVTEGLEEGQDYYYRYAETVDYTFS